MNNNGIWYAIFIIVLSTLIFVTPAFAQGTISIDGTFTDWVGHARYVDTGGADDETAPSRADITEFRAASDSGGVYLLKAWDDTRFSAATVAGITVRGADNNYYRIYSTANGNPGSVPLSSLDINSCTDSTCGTQNDLCTGTGCTSALAGSGTTWADPFAGRATPGCFGTNCGTLDTAVELYIPWNLIGGAPANGDTIFLQFGSYPAGPAQAAKDSSGPNGIMCLNNNGSFECHPSTPTSIGLENFSSRPAPVESQPVKIALIIVLSISLILTAVMLTQRKPKQSSNF